MLFRALPASETRPVSIGGKSARWSLAFVASAALAVVLGLAPTATAAAVEWPQAHSDVAPDPAVRFGVLPNGMRYAIKKNATPKGVVSIRLRIGAGSLEERDDQQGLAHFLEHMAFRGSTHVPEAEVWRDIQRLGMTVGADANAHTTSTETVFQFDLPKNDTETIDAGLMRMREIASELTLSQSAMDAERGVVLSEMRLGDTPNYHAQKAQLGFTFEGQRLPERMPIGLAEVLQHAPVGLIADFYHAYYRPERATLIVVGDIDPIALEAQIRAHFADWRPVGRPGADPVLGQPLPRGVETKLFIEPGAQPAFALKWVRPYDPAVETQARDRRETIEQIALAVLNLRLQTAATRPERPFISAGALRRDVAHSANVTDLAVSAEPEHYGTALRAAETIRRAAVEFGVRQDEVDLVLTRLRALLEAAAAGAATRSSPGLANALINSVELGNDVPTSPVQNLAAFRKQTEGLTAAEVTAALRADFTGSGPLLFVSSPKPIEGGEAGLTAALAAADAAPITASAPEPIVAWPYGSFGAPGKVIARTEVADLGVSQMTFANGVHLAVKPTKFAADRVIVWVTLGHGALGAPKNQKPVSWALATFTLGGLKGISLEEMSRTLASRTYSETVRWGPEVDGLQLGGGTRTEDLDIQMQILAAYMTDPGWRPEAFERLRAAYLEQLPQSDFSPGGALGRKLALLLHGGDARFATASADDVAASRLQDLQAAVAPSLASGPINVTIVGDLTVDQAIAATAATFGALPPRPAGADIPPGARDVHFPAPTPSPVVLRHKGRSDKAAAMIAWPTTDFYADPKGARDLRLVERILNQRLIEKLRISDAVTYAPSTSLHSSDVLPGYGYLDASAELPPEKVSLFYTTVSEIVGDLKANQVSADELERARAARVEQFVQAQQTNAYWAGQIAAAQVDPRQFDTLRSTIPDLKRVTAADVQRAAQTYLKDETAWKLVVLPTAAPGPAP
jgi:zinc protease